MDIEIKGLRKKLVDEINAAELPMEVKRLVLREILDEVTEAVNQAIMAQAAEMKEEQPDEQDIHENQLGKLSE